MDLGQQMTQAGSPAHDGGDLEGRHAPGSSLLEQGSQHTQHTRTLRPDSQPMLGQDAQVPVCIQTLHVLQACRICTADSRWQVSART